MKGVVFLGDCKLEFRRFPDPTPGPRDVILEIKGLGHVRQRPAHLPRPGQSGWSRHGWDQAGGRRDMR